MRIESKRPEAVVRRAMFLAYEASQIAGLGFLQAAPGMSEADVWERGIDESPGRASGDYIFGRMVKLHLRYDATNIEIPDPDFGPRGDYQSWCHKYPTYATLIAAAEKSLGN